MIYHIILAVAIVALVADLAFLVINHLRKPQPAKVTVSLAEAEWLHEAWDIVQGRTVTDRVQRKASEVLARVLQDVYDRAEA